MSNHQNNGLSGKVALVTGASRGIGRAIAEALGRRGATVAVHYGRNKAAADAAVGAIKQAGGDAFSVKADLGKPGSVGDLFEELDIELKCRTGSNRFDILVNNAGIAPFVGFKETTEAQFDEIYSVNVKAPFFIAQEAEKRLNDDGRVINLSTAAVRTPVTEVAAYSALKAPIDNLTKSLAMQLGTRNITVNAVAPGVVDTDMAAGITGSNEGVDMALSKQALKRLGKPDDVADVVAFLAGPESRWVTGQVIEVSGGTAITYS